MKSKGCLTSLFALFLIIVAGAFLLPKNMNVELMQTLEASPEQVFYQVNNVKNWKNWSPWFEMDKDMKVEYSPKAAGNGAYYAWESQKKYVGNGKMDINESILNEKVGTVLAFGDTLHGGNADLFFKPNGTGTDVVWDFTSDYKAKFWQTYNAFFSRMMIKNSYKKGLKNLESYIKENPEAHIFKNPHPEVIIEETVLESFNGLTVESEGKWSEFGSHVYAEAFGTVMGNVFANRLEMAGAPFGHWTEWDTSANHYKLEIGVPVKSGGKIYKGGNAIKANYYGDYSGMDIAYMALEAYGNHHGYLLGMPYDFFVTDPVAEKDTTKWLTEIYFPIE